MTVEVTSYFSGPYITNGATTVFPFSFISMDADELGVLLRDADGVDTVVSTSLYSVTRAADGTGSVVFSTAPASGSDLYIFSDVSFAQSVEFEDGSGWKAAPVNSVADRSAARDIWLKGKLSRSLMAPLGEAPSELPSVDNRLGKFLAFDASGNPVAADGTGPDGGLRSDLAASGGSALIGFLQGRSMEEKASDILHAKDFGAVGDGVADDTDALIDMLADMQATGKMGLWGGDGDTRYKVREGELIWTFDNSPTVDSPGPAGPMLHTSGKVTLVAAGVADAPLFSIYNDPVNGSRFIHSGYIGPLHFEDTTVAGAPTERHGLYLHGLNNVYFGLMTAVNGLRGDLIHLAEIGTTITADAWHVFGCYFEGAVNWNGDGYAFNSNVVGQVFNYCTIGQIYAVGNKGAFRGAGAGVRIEGITANLCTDWSVDITPSEGTVQGMSIGFMELDAPKYGIRMAGIQHVKIDMARIIYRRDEFGIPALETWPIEPIKFDDIAGGQVVTDVDMTVRHRFNDLDLIGDIPATIVDYGNDANFQSINIDHFYSAPGGFGVLSGALFYDNLNAGSIGCTATLESKPIIDQSYSNAVTIVRAASGAGSTSYDGSAPLVFSSSMVDQLSAWDGTNHRFVCRVAGVYRLRCQLLIQPTAGDLVRLGFFLNAGSTPVRETNMEVPTGYAATDPFPIEADALYPLAVGDTIKVCLYEVNARAFLAGSAGIAQNNYFEAVLI